MLRDYAYCNTTNCFKRKECKRWSGHCKKEEFDCYQSYVDDVDCMSKQNYLFEKKTQKKDNK